MDGLKAKKLIFDLVRMLMTYEVELTAYHQVFRAIEQRVKLEGNRSMLVSP